MHYVPAAGDTRLRDSIPGSHLSQAYPAVECIRCEFRWKARSERWINGAEQLLQLLNQGSRLGIVEAADLIMCIRWGWSHTFVTHDQSHFSRRALRCHATDTIPSSKP